MNAKTRTFILAAIVASVAVLAVLPADDVSADGATVVYDGYDDEGTYLTFTLNEAQAYIVIHITGNGQTYIGTSGDAANAKAVHPVFIDAQMAVGTYTYTVGSTQDADAYATGEFTISELKQFGQETVYNVTVAPSEHGVISAEPVSGTSGTSVTLTIAPAEGYKLKTLTVAGEDVTSAVVDGKYTFTLSAETAVSAEYELIAAEHSITIDAAIENGTVTADVEKAVAKTPVALTVTPDEGYQVDKVTVNGTAIEAVDGAYSFDMPDEDVTVSATFVKKAVEPTVFKVTVADSENGKVTASPESGVADTEITLTIAADEGYSLKTLTVAGSDVTSAVADGKYIFKIAVDTSVSAVFEKSATPVDPDQEYIVEFSSDIESVKTADGTAVASGDKVKAGTVLTVVAKTVEGKTATVSPALTNGTYTVTGEVSFTVAYEDEKNTGIYADGEYRESVQAAVDAVASKATAASKQTVEISKDITGDVTLADNVVVKVTEDGSYNGTVTYSDAQGVVSTVAVKIAKGSSVTITGGSVEIAGTFVGANEFDVTSGTAVLSGEVKENSTVVVNVDDGAKLQIGAMKVDETSTVQIVYSDAQQISFVPKTTYEGPAVVNASGVVEKIPYNEGSRISFVENEVRVYENIYHLTSGGVDITVGVADFVVDYQGREIVDSDVYTQTARVDSYTEGYQPRSNATPKLADTGATIELPNTYPKAVEVFVVGGENAQGLSRVVNANLTVRALDLGDLNIVADPEEYVYTSETIVPTLKVTDADLEFDLSKAKIVYQDAQGNDVSPVNVGTYYAVVSAGTNTNYSGTKNVEFRIVKAPVTITMTDATDGAGWLSEQYKDGTVTYTLSAPTTDGALTFTAKITLKDGTTETLTATGVQDDLDELLASIVGEKYDAGYTLEISMVSAETANFLAGASNTLTIQVGAYEATKITATFSDVDDSNVKTTQDGLTVKIVAADKAGLSAGQDGKYSFTVNVKASPAAIVMQKTDDTKVTGRTVLTPAEYYTYDADSEITAISFSFEKLPAGTYKMTIYAGDDETRYITSDEYTIDLTGLVSNEVALYLVEENYATLRYTTNQLNDLSASATPLADGVKFYLPATAAATNGHWELQLPSTSTKTTTYYADNGAYLVDTADRTTYTAWNGETYYGIVFVAAAGSDTPVDPEQKQSITIAATGYYADADVAKDAINSAIKGLGLTSEITDVEKDTMFVIWYHATGGTFTGTLTFSDANGEAVTCDLGQHTSDKAGYGIFYFTSYKHEDGSENGYVDGFEKYVAGSQYTIVIADGDVSAKVIAGNSGSDTPAPSTETSTEVRAALVVDDDGVYLMMVAKDGKAIPDGTISVTYSYTETVMFHGQERTRSNTATFTQDYTADGNAYAYVLLDFQNKASENYDSVFGISAASFTYGQTTVNAGSASFTLPEIPETETRA